ncbi:MAG TPA: PilZ domain-containing protein [Burkholderiaceae bacterium]
MIPEQRQSPRRVLKVKAMVAMAGEQPVQVRTYDVGNQGVGIVMPHPVKPGAAGQISFDLYFDGRSNAIKSNVKVAHCIFGGGEFKVGLNFAGIDAAGAAAISQYLR